MREGAQAWLHESSCVFVFLFFLLYPFIPQRLWVFAERARCCFCCVIRRSEAEQMKPKRSVWEPVWIRLQSWSGFIILAEYWGWRSNCSAWHGFNAQVHWKPRYHLILMWSSRLCPVELQAKESSQLHTHNLLQRLRGQFENPGWHQIKQRRITFYTLLQSK